MVSIQDIPYRNLPNQPELFLQYLEQSPQALRFFRYAPTIENLGADLRTRILRRQFARSEITAILRRQNIGCECDPETLKHIDDLEHPDCVAILTGQQVGIFSGPLYTIYKALTAIHLSYELRNRGIPAVPVFWMETEDHDLAEVTHQTVLTPDDSAQTINYRDILFGNDHASIRPVGSIQFPDSIREVVRSFVDCLPESEWKPEIRSLLDSTYFPGSTFTQSFARLLHKILHGTGLILFDPRDPQTKPLIAHLFQWAIERSADIHASLVGRNRELESAGFHSQVHISENSTVLFHIERGERHALERRDAGFGLKNRDRKFGLRELMDCAGEHPEKFSPNVLLRPLVQDTLFPTLAYVGGPAELAYFAQIEAVYALRELPMPVIWPRESFTLLEAGIRKAMHRLGIDIQDCFEGIQSLKEKALRNAGSGSAGSGLRELKKILGEKFSEIRPEAGILDPSLPQALDTAQRKILYNIERLKSRVLHIEGSRNSPVLEAAGLLMNQCLPNRNLQERELSIHHFLSLHGPDVLDAIRSGIGTTGFFHHVLQLE
jgi:bacillithiol biosynthesis cysteine-adding enzyme BshC